MKNSKSSSGSSMGFMGALTVAFIILKLCGVIKLSWLWVLAPAWISVLLGIVIIIIMLSVDRW